MRVGIDIDGTVCEMTPSLCRMANEWLGTDYAEKDVTTWNHLFRSMDGELVSINALIDRAFNTPDFIASLPVIPGAVEAVQRIAADHDVTFITCRPINGARDTVAWVNRHFGEFPIIHAGGLKNHGLDILVDDAPHHVENFKGRMAFLYDRPWNQAIREMHCSRIRRADGWATIVRWFCQNCSDCQAAGCVSKGLDMTPIVLCPHYFPTEEVRP